MNNLHLALKYGLFAVAATLINLLTQEASIRTYAGAWSLTIAILAGTLSGLVSKYQLDKHYIFLFQANSRHEDMGKFFAYALTGCLTTALFWGSELGFHYWFGSTTARYFGACIGLATGYGLKYQLDKHFVFVQQEA
jgi:putative flippase GtrA